MKLSNKARRLLKRIYKTDDGFIKLAIIGRAKTGKKSKASGNAQSMPRQRASKSS